MCNSHCCLLKEAAIIVLATSRLIFAIARDGALPFSSWVGAVSPDGRPQHAVKFMWAFCALLLCTILASTSAFTSIISAGAVPLAASYGLIALLRLTITPNGFRSTRFSLGRYKLVFYASSALFNALLCAVCSPLFTFRLRNVEPTMVSSYYFISQVLASPFIFPVSVPSMNFVWRFLFFSHMHRFYPLLFSVSLTDA